MKLYRIIVLHGAPKDSHTATETYLVAKDEEKVARWIQAKKCHGYWLDPEEGEEPSMRCHPDDWQKEITFREYVMLKRGDLEDDEGWEDAYYGVTKWGWEEIESATDKDISRLVELGIAIKAK